MTATATSSHTTTGQDADVFPRLQLALNVPNLDEAIAFYNDLFDATPHKVREGYANYALNSPPLKLVLFENADAPERLNHLGVEVATQADVVAHTQRVSASMPVQIEDGTVCCHALQDKFWVDGPGRTKWEYYTVLDDEPAEAAGVCCGEEESTCC